MKKILNANLKREDYEQKTVESLDAIKLQCESLLHEADKTSKYHTVHMTNAILESMFVEMPAFNSTPRTYKKVNLFLGTVSSEATLQQINEKPSTAS